jgi:membrane protein DedA with SNARE-associated domain
MLDELLTRFGLPAALVASALDGDVGPLLAGVAVHTSHLHLLAASVACGLGLVCADLFWWQMGRGAAGRLHATRAWQRVGPTVDRLARRWGPLEIPLARLVFGTRTASMLFWGAEGLPWHRLLLYDAPACLAWATFLVLLGRGTSHGMTFLLGEVKRTETWMLGALLVAGAVLTLWRLLLRRQRARAGLSAPHPASSPPPREIRR